MTQSQLIQSLLELPANLKQLENDVVDLEERKRQMEFALEARKAELLIQEDGPINGKNSEVRAAQLLQYTQPDALLIADLETTISKKKVDVAYWKRMLASNLVIAQFLGAAVGYNESQREVISNE